MKILTKKIGDEIILDPWGSQNEKQAKPPPLY